MNSADIAVAKPRERFLAWDLRAWSVVGLCVLAVGLRLIPILVYPSIFYPDEIFQTIEQAHRIVFGFGLVPWEFQVGARSLLLPDAIAGLMALARLFGGGAGVYLPLIAGSLAALSLASVLCGFLWARRLTGFAGGLVAAAAIAVWPDGIYFDARAFNEVVAGHVMLVALFLATGDAAAPTRRRLFILGALLGLALVLRPQLGPALAVVALWVAWPAPRSRLLPMALGAGLVLALDAGFDTVTLGYPFAWLHQNLLYNLHYGASAGFGVEPPQFYLLATLWLWGAAAPAVLLLAVLGARRLPLAAIVAVVIIATHSAIGHKEIRFIYPALELLVILAALGLARIVAFIIERLGQRPDPLRWPGLAPMAALTLWCVGAGITAATPNYLQLWNRSHAVLAAQAYVRSLPEVCGVATYQMSWLETGGYAYFHRSVPWYRPADAGELARLTPAFDTLVYEQPTPSAAGFETRQCFDEVCVAQRPGRCTPQPVPPLPWPVFLRDLRTTDRR